jgi:hypothetical protein
VAARGTVVEAEEEKKRLPTVEARKNESDLSIEEYLLSGEEYLVGGGEGAVFAIGFLNDVVDSQ